MSSTPSDSASARDHDEQDGTKGAGHQQEQACQADIAAGLVRGDETLVGSGKEDEISREHESGEAKKRAALDRQIRVAEAYMIVFGDDVLVLGESDNSQPLLA